GRTRARARSRGGHAAAPTAAARGAGPSAAALLPDAHADLDRRAGEAEGLPQPALDEPPVPVLDEPGGEEDEARRAGVGLGGEEDARLLAPAYRVRVCCGELPEEGVEPPGGDAGVPALERGVQRLDQPIDVPARLGGDVDPRCPLQLPEVLVDRPLELEPLVLVHEVPFVVGDDERPP